MSFENNENENKIVETTVETTELENTTAKEINKITDNFFEENYKSAKSASANFNNNFNNSNGNFSSFSGSASNFGSTATGSINLTLDAATTKNMKFIAKVIKVFSVLGIISGAFQILLFFIGVFTILISIKFFKAATALEEALYAKDENKLKLYFSEQAKGFKLYIIFIIVIMVLTALFYGIVIIFALLQASSSSV